MSLVKYHHLSHILTLIDRAINEREDEKDNDI